MPDYIYFIEIHRFKGKKTYGLIGKYKNINYYEIKNKEFAAQIQEELNNYDLDLNINQIFEVNVKFGKDFEFLVLINSVSIRLISIH